MHAFGINVHSVVIGESGDAVLVRMFYTDAEDKERIMYTNVSRAVLFALPNKIPIYVEELLLIKLSKVDTAQLPTPNWHPPNRCGAGGTSLFYQKRRQTYRCGPECDTRATKRTQRNKKRS